MVRSSKLALVAVVGALAFTAGVAADADDKVRPRPAAAAPAAAAVPLGGYLGPRYL